MTKVYRVENAASAELKVYVTEARVDADLVVFETPDRWAANKPEIWYYTNLMHEADRVLCFTRARWDADLIIYRADTGRDAGWINYDKAHLL